MSDSDIQLENPIRFDNLGEFLVEVLGVVIVIALPIIVLAIIYAGFLFVSAQGDESKIKSAKSIFTWTVVGAGIILGAQVIAFAIQATIEALR